ncbi:hypothetical protein ACFLV6_03500 [Chloroflexota bacterium]
MKKRYIVIIAVAVVLVLGATFLAQSLTMYSTQVVVVEKGSPVGIAPFTDRVDFGDMPAGLGTAKIINLENAGTVPNTIRVYVTGSIAKFITVEPDSSFTLEGEQALELNLNIYIPESSTPGQKFTGRIFILRIPRAMW